MGFGLKITVGPNAQPDEPDEQPARTPTGDELRSQVDSQEPADQQLVRDAAAEADRRGETSVTAPAGKFGLAITVQPPEEKPGFFERATKAVKGMFTGAAEAPAADLRGVPEAPPAEVPEPESPDLVRARRAAQAVRIDDLTPRSAEPEYESDAGGNPVRVRRPTQKPNLNVDRVMTEGKLPGRTPATELPGTVSVVRKPPKLEPNSLWEKLGVVDPEQAAAQAAEAVFTNKSVMNRPELDDPASRKAYLERVRGPKPTPMDENFLLMRDANAYPRDTDFWGQAMRVVERSVGGAMLQFSNEQMAGGLRAFEHGWDRVMEPESVLEMVAQGMGQAAGFATGAPVRLARATLAGAFGARMAEHAAPAIGTLLSRAGATALIKATANEAANLGLASAYAHAAEYGMEPTVEQAFHAMGQHVAGGAEMGAVFGAVGTAMPGGWTSFRDLLGDVREGGPELSQKALRTVARIGVGSTAMVANEAAHGTLNTDNISKMTYDFALNAYFLALAGHGAIDQVQRDAYERGMSPLEALREIRVRRIGDEIVVEKLSPALAPGGGEPIYDRIGAVDAKTMRAPADDYAAGLTDILGHEPVVAAERPAEAPPAPADYSAGLDEIFGESGSRLGTAVEEARARIVGEPGGALEDISRRGVDIRGSFGPGWEQNRMLMNDLATAGAAHLWQGDRSFLRWSNAMVAEYGENVRPQLERLYAMSQKAMDSLVDIAPDKLPTTARVLKLLHAGQRATPESHDLSPAFWYDKAEPEIRRMFGRNAELYARVLASTSPNTAVAANITMANRAMKMILSGERSLERPFIPGKRADGGDGFMEAHANNLNRVLRGQPLEGPKVEPFGRALMGDRNAIVVDTWMLRAFGLGDNTSEPKTRFVQGAISRWSREFGMDPRQIQAAIWAGVKRRDEGKTTALPPIDRAIEAKLEQIAPWLRDMEDSHPAIARRLAESEGQDPMVERLAGVVARGKAAGIAPDQMLKDFTTRGAAPDIARAAIQRHFPGFQGEPNAPATQIPAARPNAAPEVPQARPAQGPGAPEGARPEVGRPTVAPSQQPGRVQPAPAVRPEQRGAVPGRAGAGQPGATGAAGPRAPAANVPGRAGEPAQESRLRTVYPRGGAAVEPDARLGPHLAVLKPHQAEDATRILKGLDGQHRSYGLFNGAGSGKTYVVLAALDAMRRQGVPVYYVSPSSVLQIDPKTREMSGTLKEASERLGIPVRLFSGVGRPQGDAVHVMSYEKFKKLDPDQNVVIAFDESHYLKNVETGLAGSRADRGAEWMKAARGVILATATPLDKATHIPYLERLGVFEGKAKDQAMADLGVVRQQAQTGQMFWRALDEGVTATRIEALFERLAAAGQISAREIQMDGIPVTIKQVEIDRPSVDRMTANILRGYGVNSVDEIRGVYKAVAIESIRRQLEPYKIEPAVALAKQELAEGRQVVLYVSRINYSAARTPKKLGRQVVAQSEGTAKTLKERLAAEGIGDIVELHGNSEQERAQAVADFQSGKARVLIATPESGAAGINLDDQVGNKPRSTIMITAPYGATENVQSTGRTWRLNTKSDPRYFYLDSGEEADARNLRIVAAKLRTLGAVVQSEVARKLESPDISRREHPDYKGWITPEGENKTHPGDVAHSEALKKLGFQEGEGAAIKDGWVRHFRIDRPSDPGYAPSVSLDLNPEVEGARSHAIDYLRQYGTARHDVFLDLMQGGGGALLFEKVRDAIRYLEDYGNGARPQWEIRPEGKVWSAVDTRYPSSIVRRFHNEEAARAWLEKQQPPDIVRRTSEVERERKAAVDHPAFRRWFGRSRVTDEDGRPVIVYHGTTHDFGEFRPERGNPENAFGSGYYFTSDPEDAGKNYAGAIRTPEGGTEILHGQDLQSRIMARADEIDGQHRGEPEWEALTDEERFERSVAVATQELSGQNSNVMPAYLKMRKPLEIERNGGTRFTIDYNERTGAETGNGVKLYDAIMQVGAEMEFDGQKVFNKVAENGLEDTTAYEVVQALKSSDELLEAVSPEGRYVSGEAIKRIFQEMGYDGIIQRDVDQEYKTMGIEPGATHYVVFEPTQIKSATGNRGTWSLRTGDITRRANAGEDDNLFREPGQLSPRFYSNVERVIQAKIPNLVSGEQAWNTLKNTPGVKAEELKWLGLNEQFLKGKPKWTKDELLGFVRAHDLEPDITMIGGPTPTGASPDTQKLHDRVAVAQGDQQRASEVLGEYRAFIEQKLIERLERQNEIAKARGKRNRKTPKEQLLPGFKEPGEAPITGEAGQFGGRPGAMPTVERPPFGARPRRTDQGVVWDVDDLRTDEPRMQGFRTQQGAENYVNALLHSEGLPGEIRREVGVPATWTIDQGDYSDRGGYSFVVRRNGEVVFRSGGTNGSTADHRQEATEFVQEQKALEAERGEPKPEKRWKVNPVTTARKMVEALLQEPRAAIGYSSERDENEPLRIQATFLLGQSKITREGVIAELERLKAGLSEAQTQVDQAQKELARSNTALPSPQYSQYTLEGGTQYFEAGFRKKQPPENQVLKSRVAQLEDAIDQLSRSTLPTELPDGYSIKEVAPGEIQWAQDPNGPDLDGRINTEFETGRYLGTIYKHAEHGGDEGYKAKMSRRIGGEGGDEGERVFYGPDALESAKLWVKQQAARVIDEARGTPTYGVTEPDGNLVVWGHQTPTDAIEAYQDGVKNDRHDKLQEELRQTRNALQAGPKSQPDFTSGHFRGDFQKDLLFHVRGKIRVDADGRKWLALEELQSDWNIAGRTRGWKQPLLTELPAGYRIRTIEHPRVEGTTQSAEDDALLARLVDRDTDAYPWAVIAHDQSLRVKLFKSERRALEVQAGDAGYAGYEGGRVVNVETLTGTPTVEGYTEYQVMRPDAETPWLTGFRDAADARTHAIDTLNRERANGVAEAPFVKGLWQEAAMKWALRYAAEQGYDGVTWTTGKQQADRYNLAKLIDEITYQKTGGTATNPEIVYQLSGYKNGVSKFREETTEKDLPGFIGAELAKKIIADEGTRDDVFMAQIQQYPKVLKDALANASGRERDRLSADEVREIGDQWVILKKDKGEPDYPDLMHKYPTQEAAAQKLKQIHFEMPAKLSGLDLEMGGESHKALYDRQIPSFMNRYTKQWGGRVQDFDMGPRKTAPAAGRRTEPLRWSQIGTPRAEGGLGVESYTAMGGTMPVGRITPAGERWRAENLVNGHAETFGTVADAMMWVDEVSNPQPATARPTFHVWGFNGTPVADVATEARAREIAGQVTNRIVTIEGGPPRTVEQIDRDIDMLQGLRQTGQVIAAIQVLYGERDRARFPDAQPETVGELSWGDHRTFDDGGETHEGWAGSNAEDGERARVYEVGRQFRPVVLLPGGLEEPGPLQHTFENAREWIHAYRTGALDEIAAAPTGPVMHGVLITPKMRESVLGEGQPLFRGEKGRITGEMVDRALQPDRAIPITGARALLIDASGLHTAERLGEIAARPYLRDLVPVLERGFEQIAGMMAPRGEEFGRVRLRALDTYIEQPMAKAYNRYGMDEAFLNLHAHLLGEVEHYGLTDSGRIAEDLVKSMVWETLRQKHWDVTDPREMDRRANAEIDLLRATGPGYDRLVAEIHRTLEGRDEHVRTALSDARALDADQRRAAASGIPAVDNGARGVPPGPEAGPRGVPAPLESGSRQQAPGEPHGREAIGTGPREGVPPVPQGVRVAPEAEPATASAPDIRRGEAQLAAPGATQAEATRAAVEYFNTVTAPPPPYTLGGGTVTRPNQANVLVRLRKDRIIQDFNQAMRDLGKGGLVLQGGLQNKRALGQSHRLSGNIRLKSITDVDTAAHEFGHRLQDALGVRPQDLVPFTGELGALTAYGRVQGPTVPEGWAEFWRMHAADPVNAARLAPGLYQWAEARLRTEPPLDAAWQAFRNQIMEIRSQNPIERVRSMIAFPEQGPSLPQQVKETIAVGNLRSMLRANIYAYFDQTLPFRLVAEGVEAATGAPLPASKDPFKWSRTLSARTIDTMNGFRKEGVMDWTTRQPVPGSKSFEAIIKAVAGSQQDFQIYQVLRRAQFLAGSTKPDGSPNETHRSTAAHLMRMADIDPVVAAKAVQDLERQYPHFKATLDDLQVWNRGLLKFMQDSGAYSAQAIAAIEQANDLYVPLHRLMDQAKDMASGAGEGSVNVGRAIKRLGGRSERLILPTLQTQMRQAMLMIGTAERNHTGRILFDAIKQIPNYGSMADQIPIPAKPSAFQLADVKGALKAAFQKSGQDPRTLDQVDLNTLATVFQPNFRDLPANQVVVWRNGEPEVWQVHDPLLLRAATTMGPNESRAFGESMGLVGSFLYKLARIPARGVQFSVVHGIDFLLGHVVRSAQEQGLQGYMVPPVIAGMKDLATGGKKQERYLAGGGRVFNFEDYSPEGIQRALNSLQYTTRNPFNLDYYREGGVMRPWRDFANVMDLVARLFDEPARVGVAKLAYDNPRAVDTTELDRVVEAAFRGRESGLDFGQRGASDLFNRYLSLVPFSHAVAVGLYRNLRNYKQAAKALSNEGLDAILKSPAGHPDRRYARGLVVYGGAMLLASLYTAWANQNDPRYLALSDQEKTGYFHFLPPWSRRFSAEEWQAMTPDEQIQYGSPYLKISKPWWPGFFQATLPATVLEGIIREDQSTADTLKKLWTSFLQSSRIEAVPTAVRIPLELKLNRRQILDLSASPRPITPDFQMKLEPEKRYGPDTPEIAKQLSAALRTVPGFSDMGPRDVQYLIQSLGYLPVYGASNAEWVARVFGGKDLPEPPAKRWGEMPGIQRFVQRFPNSHPQVVLELDAEYREAAKIAATYTVKQKDGDPDIQEYREKHRYEIGAAPVLAFWAQHMKNTWKQVDRIKSNKGLTPEEKRQRIDLLYLDTLDTSNRYMSRINEMKKAARNP